MFSGAFKTAYANGVEKSITTCWKINTAMVVNALVRDVKKNETEESFLARKLTATSAVLKPDVEEATLISGVKPALTAV
jgi:hypothetical protein